MKRGRGIFGSIRSSEALVDYFLYSGEFDRDSFNTKFTKDAQRRVEKPLSSVYLVAFFENFVLRNYIEFV